MNADTKRPKRQRRTKHNLTLQDYMTKHSPLKAGLKVTDEDENLEDVNQITRRIYLGNVQSAKSKKFFEDKKITAVLNCTKDIPNTFSKKDVEYMRIPVDDSLKERDFELMYKYMPVICEFIHKHADIQKNNILVHCAMGRERSAIAVAAYFVCKHRMTPHDACKYVMDKRPEAFWYGKSVNFDQALNRYYKDIKKRT
ncbi:hypothetical protein EB118_03585 [bacterium]|nr:hypothetical protein [bacterium]NDC94062.1 hypothetical protein [bacterium]NDD82748.1 hypothetical protein [bacterium]NDG29168.1 hypothetical protein [bacterium]